MRLADGGHRRQTLRLRGYDYRQAGAYFVTICTQERAATLADVIGDEVRLRDAGRVAQETLDGLAQHYAHVYVDASVVMPDHVHAIIVIRDVDSTVAGVTPSGAGVIPVRAGLKPAPPDVSTRHGLPEIVRAFKTFSARRINEMTGTPGAAVWQRGYYEHIVRNDDDLIRIRGYIASNPRDWTPSGGTHRRA